MSNIKFKQLIDEDFFAKKFSKLSDEDKHTYIHYLFSVGGAAKDYAKKGKLSKITANRIYEGTHRLYYWGEELPSKVKERFKEKGYSIRWIDAKLFKNAMKKFLIVSKEDKHRRLKHLIKFWEEARNDKDKRESK